MVLFKNEHSPIKQMYMLEPEAGMDKHQCPVFSAVATVADFSRVQLGSCLIATGVAYTCTYAQPYIFEPVPGVFLLGYRLFFLYRAFFIVFFLIPSRRRIIPVSCWSEKVSGDNLRGEIARRSSVPSCSSDLEETTQGSVAQPFSNRPRDHLWHRQRVEFY